jgi:membrane-bound lytic murein transglycosylase D
MIPIRDLFKNRDTRKRHFILLIGIGVILIGTTLLLFLRENPEKDEPKPSVNWQQRLGVILPPGFTFANDSLPLNDSAFLAKLKRHLPDKKNARKQMQIVINRAELWFPDIEIIVRKNNLPEDLKYLAVAESRLTNAVSPKGAAGFWQLMPAVAQKNGLEINSAIDERLSVLKSTHAACNYLQVAHAQLGNWALAAAGYNLGVNGIVKQIGKQNTSNYFELKLNPETEAYVFKLIALKCIFENTEEYGITLPSSSKTKTLAFTTDSTVIDVMAISTKYKLDVETVKKMNPWMKTERFSNSNRKTYTFEYPKENQIEKFKSILLKNEIIPKDSSVNSQSKS